MVFDINCICRFSVSARVVALNHRKFLALTIDDFLYYLDLDITANYICEIHCLALDELDLNTVHKLSNEETKICEEPGFKPRAGGWKAKMLPLCYAALTPLAIQDDPRYSRRQENHK